MTLDLIRRGSIFAFLVAEACNPSLGASGPTPRITIGMDRLGYPKRPTASNREFLQHSDPQTLNSIDINSHLVALSSKMLLIYSTRPDFGHTPWGSSSVRAFFLDTDSGGLIRTETWPIRARTTFSEEVDSEGRIYPLHDGEYLVSSQNGISRYSLKGELLQKRSFGTVFGIKLAPLRGTFLVSSATPGSGDYTWLDLQTLETIRHFARPRSYGRPYTIAPLEDSLISKEVDGLHQIFFDGRNRLFCTDEICRDSYGLILTLAGAELTGPLVASMSSYGLGIASVRDGLRWAKTVNQDLGLGHMQFLNLINSSDGRRIALYVMRGSRGRQNFDGLHLNRGEEILIYDSLGGKRIATLPYDSVDGDNAGIFSGDGRTFWTFDGRFVRGFSLPE